MTNFKIGDKVKVISDSSYYESSPDYLGLVGVVVGFECGCVGVGFGIEEEGFHSLDGKLRGNTGRWLDPKALALVNEEDLSMYEELFV